MASLVVSLRADVAPLAAGLASMNAMLEDFTGLVTAAGAALDRAFAGEAVKQVALTEAFARTTVVVEDLGGVSQQSGLMMNAAFATQAGQLAAIAAAAKATALEVGSIHPSAGGVAPAAPVGGSVAVAGISDATDGLKNFGAAARSAGGLLTTFLSGPLLLLAGFAVKTAADFEQSMGRIKGTFNLPAPAMKELSALAVKLGADITLPNTSAVDAAHALQQLMSSGLSMKDAMAASRPVLQLSAVAMIDNKEAALITAQALNAYKLSGQQAGMVTDLLTNGMRATGATAEDFAKGLTNVGPAALLTGQNIGDMSTAIAQLVRSGMTAPAAGTAITTALLRIANPTKVAAGLMKEFNIHVRDGQGAMKPWPQIMQEFQKKLQDGVTYQRAFGGETAEMNKRLKEAETAFAAAQKVIGDYPATLAVNTAHLADLQHQLTNVDEPAHRLTFTIDEQKSRLSLLTAEMVKHNRDGLEKMGRANADLTGRMRETRIEIGIQQAELVKAYTHLNQVQSQADRTVYVTPQQNEDIAEARLQVVRLQNAIRGSHEDLKDWNKQIAENSRQMREGLDSTKQKKVEIDHLTTSLDENKQKLEDWNKAGRDEKVADLNASIGKLNQSILDNKTRLEEAEKAQLKLNDARKNAQLVNVKMDQAERDHIVGQIFGQRGFKPIEIAMHTKPGDFEKLKAQITEVGTTSRIAQAIQAGLNGKIDGLRSSLENAALTFGNKFIPQIKAAVDWLTKLTERIQALTPKQVEMITNAVKFGIVLGPIVFGIGALAGSLAALLTPLGLITVGIAGLGVAWGTNFGNIRGIVAGFVTWAKPFLLTAWNAIKGDFLAAWGAIQQFGKDIWPSVQQAMQGFMAFVKAHGKEIVTVLGAAWTLIKGVVQTAWALISGIIKVGLDVINGDWKKAWADMGTLLKGAWAGIVNIIKGAGVLVVDGIGVIGEGVLDAFKKMFGNWIKAWQDLGAQLGIQATALAVGIMQGIVNGLNNLLPTVVGAVSNIAATIVSTIKNVMGIHSPSQVMHDIGQNVGQGLVNGISSMQTAAQDAMKALVNVDFANRVLQEVKFQDALASVQLPAVNNAVFGGNTAAMNQFAASQQLQAAIIARNNPSANAADPIAQGQYQGLYNQVLNSGADTLYVGGKPISKQGTTAAGGGTTVNNTTNVYGGINNAGDLESLTTKIVDKAARALRFGT